MDSLAKPQAPDKTSEGIGKKGESFRPQGGKKPPEGRRDRHGRKGRRQKPRRSKAPEELRADRVIATNNNTMRAKKHKKV
jgi:hypothetical protein